MPILDLSSQNSAPNRTAPDGLRAADREDVTAFLERCQAQGKTKKTLETYRAGAMMFGRFIADRGMPTLDKVTREHVEDFFAHLRARGNKPATVANRHRAVRALFNYLEGDDIRQDHPMAKIRPPKIPDQVQAHYEPDELATLIDSIPDRLTDRLALRDRAIIMLLADTGLRAQELCDIRIKDIDRTARTAHVVSGKAGRGRVVAFSAVVASAITRYLRHRGGWEGTGPSEPLVTLRGGQPMTPNGIRNMMLRRFAAAGIAFRGIHAFRRSFGIAFLENGGDPLDLKELAGWQSWSMLHRYTRATARSRAIRAHEAHSPIANLMNGRGAK